MIKSIILRETVEKARELVERMRRARPTGRNERGSSCWLHQISITATDLDLPNTNFGWWSFFLYRWSGLLRCFLISLFRLGLISGILLLDLGCLWGVRFRFVCFLVLSKCVNRQPSPSKGRGGGPKRA